MCVYCYIRLLMLYTQCELKINIWKTNMQGVIFTSRNNDNKDLPGFKQRTISFLSEKPLSELNKFNNFSLEGVPGELSRFYVTVNKRKNDTTIRSLQHYLLDHPDYPMTKIENKVTSLAMSPENAAEHKWLFDFDKKDGVDDFVSDLEAEGFRKEEIEVYKTVNNYAVVVPHGFDSRNILKKYDCVELKRDGLLCVAWNSIEKED